MAEEARTTKARSESVDAVAEPTHVMSAGSRGRIPALVRLSVEDLGVTFSAS